MMGLSPAEFDDMTLAEFDAAEQGHLRKTDHEFRAAMNIQRWGCFAVMSVLADLKGLSAVEVLPLPWDSKNAKKTKPKLSKKTQAQIQKEAIETARRFEAWAKK